MANVRNKVFRWFAIALIVLILDKTLARPSEDRNTKPKEDENRSSSNGTNSDTLSTMKSISKDDKTNATAIGESIKMVANQLLQGSRNPPPTTGSGGIVEDVRTPPNIKNQQANKNKAKVSTTTTKPSVIENSHAGIALPMTADELEKEMANRKKNKTSEASVKESSTTNEGISTWILLSGSPSITSTQNPNKNQSKIIIDNKNSTRKEMPKTTTSKPKSKPTPKPIRQSTTTVSKPMFTRRPVAIGSPNKADLIASGSAMNENVMNKIKATVLASVQKNKNAAMNKTTTTVAPVSTTTSTTLKPKTNNEKPKTTTTISESEGSTKAPTVKKNDNKNKKNKIEVRITTEKNPIIDNLIPESKHAEIELEVSMPPPSTTKKPKRTTNKRKKNKNRRRNPVVSTTIKPEDEVVETKIESISNKVANKEKPQKDKPITTQIYNYLSREVMPSVGVGLVSLAGLVGLASYFLYPFSGVVRRAYNVNERKDELYSQNDLYGPSDGGHSEVEMLEEVLGGNNNNKDPIVNPYAGQTQFNYAQAGQEQNLRYRNVAYNSDLNSYNTPNDRSNQYTYTQNDGSDMQGSTYTESIHYDTHISDQRDGFQSFPQQQPVYKSSENVVIGSSYPEPTRPGYVIHEKLADPVYGQAMRYNQEISLDPTKTPVMETLHLGADDVIEKQKETGYTVAAVGMDEGKPQFVVGNVPKELIQAVTPVTVPEHGPRSLRIRRSADNNETMKSSIITNLEELLKETRENTTDEELSNEIDEALGVPIKEKPKVEHNLHTTSKMQDINRATTKSVSVSNVATIDEIGKLLTTKKLETTSKPAKSEVETVPSVNKVENKIMEPLQIEVVTQKEVTSTTYKSPHVFIEVSTKNEETASESTTAFPAYPTSNEVLTSYYETENSSESTEGTNEQKPFSFVRFLKNLIEFKIRIGMGLLQTASESIARYLRNMEYSLNTAARASEYARKSRLIHN